MKEPIIRHKPLGVLVVDDSPLNRRSLSEMLSGEDGVEVVGKAADGDEALRLVTALRPDAITLDLEMPRMDGFTFLRILMARQPTPVIVVSSYSQKENVFKALELGAIDFVAKPERGGDLGLVRADLLQKIKMVRGLRLVGARPPIESAPQILEPVSEPPPAPPRWLVGIASSTGGPSAVAEIFARLPRRGRFAVLVAQHMPERFTRTFAERLDRRGAFRVSEATDGDAVTSSRGLVCPGGQSMELVGTSFSDLSVTVGPPVPADRYAPSGDRLLASLARVAGVRAVGVVLTGMGDDGVIGARAIRAAGGIVIAESEETAVVFGMPGAVVRAGLASEVLPLPAIVERLALLGS